MQSLIDEAAVERMTLEWFQGLGYSIGNAEDPAFLSERGNLGDCILKDRLESTILRINPQAQSSSLKEALRQTLLVESANLLTNNHQSHRLLVDGIDCEIKRADGSAGAEKVWLVDWTNPDANDWLVLQQFTVVENNKKRRADLVVFLNGLPLAVIELKNPSSEQTSLRQAYDQLQTYLAEIPILFQCSELLIVSDGIHARLGTISADFERFLPWRAVDEQKIVAKDLPELEPLILGVFRKDFFLELVRSFVVFENFGTKRIKKVAGYHQFHAVRKAVACTIKAAHADGDRRIGVVWHTQGSGKSLTMVFYAGMLVKEPVLENPTLLIVTDRDDLDGQLCDTFGRCSELLRQKPKQADSRENLRELLRVNTGGIVFSTMQKFLAETGEKFPELSLRRNIIVIADEAHRTQYGLRVKMDKATGEVTAGFAANLRQAIPNASFIGFTGTPVENRDHNTPLVFGDYIDTYDILRAVEDGATVPIHYEPRLANLDLNEAEIPRLDLEYEELRETEEGEKGKAKSNWAKVEAIVGSDKRLDHVAGDLVEHWEKRYNALEGKCMMVCMSRRIAVEMYNRIAQLRPNWVSLDDDKGRVKIVMTGSAADGPDWQQHIGTKQRREHIGKRLKDPKDPLFLVFVRDMFLTGFDAPCLHTLYVDKPMQGHGLMQAIARVNRVFKDKPGGLVVDYLGLAESLKRALADYTEDDKNQTGIPIEEAVDAFLALLEVVQNLFHPIDYRPALKGNDKDRLWILKKLMDHALDPERRPRVLTQVAKLSRAAALATPHPEVMAVEEEIALFQAVRALIVKDTNFGEGRANEPRVDWDSAVKQLVSRGLSGGEVIDLFEAAGLRKPNLGIFSEEFLNEVRQLPERNLAVEALRLLLAAEVKRSGKKSIVKERKFSEMLESLLARYKNQALTSAQVIEELVLLYRELITAQKRGEDLKLTEEELAFYEALEANDSAVEGLGEPLLVKIAQELTRLIREHASIDWQKRESVRAKLRVLVRRTLAKFGYPPDKTQKTVDTILEQAERLAEMAA